MTHAEFRQHLADLRLSARLFQQLADAIEAGGLEVGEMMEVYLSNTRDANASLRDLIDGVEQWTAKGHEGEEWKHAGSGGQ